MLYRDMSGMSAWASSVEVGLLVQIVVQVSVPMRTLDILIQYSNAPVLINNRSGKFRRNLFSESVFPF